jgi:hypothetical protein
LGVRRKKGVRETRVGSFPSEPLIQQQLVHPCTNVLYIHVIPTQHNTSNMLHMFARMSIRDDVGIDAEGCHHQNVDKEGGKGEGEETCHVFHFEADQYVGRYLKRSRNF